MKNLKYIITLFFIFSVVLVQAAEISISVRGGYSPAVGGSMSSGWQADNLGVYDGINDINRSGGGQAVSSVEDPLGVIAGADLRIISNSIYYRAGIEYVYVLTGGTGKTLDPGGTEVVKVAYSQWSFDVPVTIGVALLFWGESRIYLGVGAAFAYGTYSNSFKSATLDHSASFTAYAVPLVAEFGCEYMVNDRVSFGCDVKYLYGRSPIVKDGADYARVDFSGVRITASAALHFNI
jgi:opacity protein-like surface antigen